MTDAKRDNNMVPIILGVLNTDGLTPTPPQIDPTTHVLQVLDGTTGSDLGNDAAARDNNSVTTMTATDSNGTIIPLYVNSSGQLLIQTT